MKNLMIYSKYRHLNLIESIRNNSTTIFILSLFISGIIIGAYLPLTSSNVYIIIQNNLIELNTIITLIAFLTVIFLIYTWGLSCMSIPYLLIIPIVSGIYFGLIATVSLINYGIKGMGIFIMKELISAAIISSAILLSVNITLQASWNTTEILIFSKDNKINIKKYFMF